MLNKYESFMTELRRVFLIQSEFGIYAYITPIELNYVYNEFVDSDITVQEFVHNYARSRNLSITISG
jgi:hypothetical protein